VTIRRMTALRVGNFKAFSDTQRLPLKPITLIYGPNSAGKSSLVQALALAHESEFGNASTEQSAPDVHQTRLGGSAIDLGGFRQYVHRGQAARRVEWGAELDVASIDKAGSGRLAGHLAPASRVALTISLGIEVDDQERPRPGAEPRVEEIQITADGAELVRMSRRPAADGAADQGARFRVDRLAVEHPMLSRAIVEAIADSAKPEDRGQRDPADIMQILGTLVPSLLVRTGRFLPTDAEVSLEETRSAPAASERLQLALERLLPPLLEQLVVGIATAVREEIGTLRYLGPIRSLPPRHLALTEQSDTNRMAGGAWAWDEVRRDDSVRAAVNAWLGSERLKTPYELSVRSLVPLEGMQRIIEDELLDEQYAESDSAGAVSWGQASRSNGPGDDPSSSGLASRLASALASTANVRFRELVLVDKRRDTVVTHRDVGVGISQVLPVLVMCYGSRGAMLAMEQPEIHLHPGLQAELGDVFIQAAMSERRNTLIIETHSEHLLLRIMRRIRETAKGAAHGHPLISAEDVAILYVDPHGQGSAVREMPLTAGGELAKSWPGGFFEEGLREQFDDA